MLAYLGPAADVEWTPTTAPKAVQHAIVLLTNYYYEQRGDDLGLGNREVAIVWHEIDNLVALSRPGDCVMGIGAYRHVVTLEQPNDAHVPVSRAPTFPLDGLVNYWKLDEASGMRLDSHGTNHLTPTNAPVGTAGKLGTACDFAAGSAQYLSHPDPDPVGDETFTHTLWFKKASHVPYGALLGKDYSYTLRDSGSGRLVFFIGDSLPGGITGPFILDTDLALRGDLARRHRERDPHVRRWRGPTLSRDDRTPTGSTGTVHDGSWLERVTSTARSTRSDSGGAC